MDAEQTVRAAAGTPRRIAFVAAVLAAALIAATIASCGYMEPPLRPVRTATPIIPPRFATARLQSAVPGQLRGAAIVFTETGMPPGRVTSYHVSGYARLLYDCGQGGPGGPSYPSAGAVELFFTRTADAQGTIAVEMAIPAPTVVPPCPAGRQPVVTGDYLNFGVTDTSAGVGTNAGSIDIAI